MILPTQNFSQFCHTNTVTNINDTNSSSIAKTWNSRSFLPFFVYWLYRSGLQPLYPSVSPLQRNTRICTLLMPVPSKTSWSLNKLLCFDLVWDNFKPYLMKVFAIYTKCLVQIQVLWPNTLVCLSLVLAVSPISVWSTRWAHFGSCGSSRWLCQVHRCRRGEDGGPGRNDWR